MFLFNKDKEISEMRLAKCEIICFFLSETEKPQNIWEWNEFWILQEYLEALPP